VWVAASSMPPAWTGCGPQCLAISRDSRIATGWAAAGVSRSVIGIVDPADHVGTADASPCAI
jgi:hypothetical protein